MRPIREMQRQYRLAQRRPNRRGRLLVRSRPRPLWIRLGMLILIGSTTALSGLLIWSGGSWIVNPYQPNGLVQAFPAWFTSDYQPMQSLEEVEAELSQAGLVLGEPIVWKPQPTMAALTSDWIVPVLKSTSARTNAGVALEIVELRIYRPQNRLLGHQARQFQRVIDPVIVRPPQRSVITAPLENSALAVAASDQTAPFRRLSLFPDPSGHSDWIMLSGSQTRGKLQIAYGQLLYYSPHLAQFSPLLTWTSPTGKPPYFKELDGSAPPELIVEQTIGLEPRLRAYRLKPVQPPQVELISLAERALDQPAGSLYDKALVLARSGLWSPALQIMQTAKVQLGADWKPAAEAQLSLIAAHAEISRSQSQRTWSRLEQQVLANLLDGRWAEALSLLEANPACSDQLLELLKSDASRLWQRFQAFDLAYPNVAEAQIWAALVVVAEADDAAGKAWLAQYMAEPTTRDRLQKILTQASAAEPIAKSPRWVSRQ